MNDAQIVSLPHLPKAGQAKAILQRWQQQVDGRSAVSGETDGSGRQKLYGSAQVRQWLRAGGIAA